MVFKLKTTWYEVVISTLLFVYFLFGLSNIAGLQDVAQFYAFVALGSLVIAPVADFLIPDKFEKPPIKVPRNTLIFGCAVIFFFMLWYLQGTGYAIVAAPEFASIQLDSTGQAINSGLAGIAEDNLFFSALPFLMAGVVYKITKKWDLAVIVFFLTGIIGFTAFHWARYGTDVPALTTTAMFAIFNTSAVYMTGYLIFSHCGHFFNNFFIRYFKVATISTLMFTLFYSPMVWFIIIGFVVLLYFYKRK